MKGISCVCVGGSDERSSEDSFVYVGAKHHDGLASEISYEIGRRRGKEGPREMNEQGGVSNSQGNATVRERQLLKEELGPVDPEAGLASARG